MGKILLIIVATVACAFPKGPPPTRYYPIQGAYVAPWEQAREICWATYTREYGTGKSVIGYLDRPCLARYGWILRYTNE